jgi:hypothetical protein
VRCTHEALVVELRIEFAGSHREEVAYLPHNTVLGSNLPVLRYSED